LQQDQHFIKVLIKCAASQREATGM